MTKIKSTLLFLIGLFAISCTQTNNDTSELKEGDSNTTVVSNQTIDIKTEKYIDAVLDTIFKTEQTPIRKRDSLMKIYGPDSKEFQHYQAIYKKNHVVNERKVKELLATYGWPGEDVIGYRGSLTMCNVIQHADNEVRLELLPLMRRAVQDKKLNPALLARTEDRIATEQGKLQMYGGQMKYYPETKSFNVWPVYDPANIDKRRAAIGLGPIAEHLKSRFDFEWNLDEQIKRTEAFEKARKNKEQ